MTSKSPSLADPKTSFDLGDLDTTKGANQGYEIQLMHPSKKTPIPIWITVYGSDSDIYNELKHERVNDALKRNAEARAQGRDPEIKTSEQIDQEEIMALAACTKSWRSDEAEGFIIMNGAKLACNVPNCMKVYKISWVREQVAKAINSVENFIPK